MGSYYFCVTLSLSKFPRFLSYQDLNFKTRKEYSRRNLWWSFSWKVLSKKICDESARETKFQRDKKINFKKERDKRVVRKISQGMWMSNTGAHYAWTSTSSLPLSFFLYTIHTIGSPIHCKRNLWWSPLLEDLQNKRRLRLTRGSVWISKGNYFAYKSSQDRVQLWEEFQAKENRKEYK